MVDIRSLLSCSPSEGEALFTAADIRWVESVLGLKDGFDQHQLKVLQNIDTIDVEACPGSGKTTVLVARLALLSRYWNSASQGICVLSMTNAARDEIQEKLGNTPEGLKLLRPPHFIGTIHGFFSEFLAKPYMNSKNMPLFSIDDDFCRSQRRKTLQKDAFLPLTDYLVDQQVNKRQEDKQKNRVGTKAYAKADDWLIEHERMSLEERRKKIPVHWQMQDIEFNVVTDQGKGLDLPEELLILQRDAVREVVDKGIFSFSDIFLYARELMKSVPDIYNIIRHRFPLLLIDEAQDTSHTQAEILFDLFISERGTGGRSVTRQRFGDANQTIYSFDGSPPEVQVDPYPSATIPRLTIPVSHRFDQSIANLAACFETEPLAIKMTGMRPHPGLATNHCIIIFDDASRSQVIPAFAELAKKELDAHTWASAKIRVCAQIQKDKESTATGEEYARTISDYYSSYISDKLTRDYQQHKSLTGYIRHGRFLVKGSRNIGQGLEKIAEGIFKSDILLSEKYPGNLSGTRFYKIKTNLHKHRALLKSLTKNTAIAYTQCVINLLTLPDELTEARWDEFVAVLNRVLCELLSPLTPEIDGEYFFRWHDDEDTKDSALAEHQHYQEKGNIYRHAFSNSEEFIDIKLGTIHSVKGQTHTATLLLESCYKGPIFGQLKAYLIGDSRSQEATGKKREWLNALYVGLTRPTHLVCLAIPTSHKNNTSKQPMNWTVEDLAKLKARGWKIRQLTVLGQLDEI